MKIRVTAKNYQQEVLQSEVPVLVEFVAAWCGKCAMMEDVVDEIATDFAGLIKVCQIDIEECKILASNFEIEMVPTFVFFKGGKPVSVSSGVLNKELLIEMIET